MKITTALCAATLGSAALGAPVTSMLNPQHQQSTVSPKPHSIASYLESSARRFHLPFSLSFLGHSKPSPKDLPESSSLEDTLAFLDDAEVAEVLTAPRPLATAYLMSLKPKTKAKTKAKPETKPHSPSPVPGQEQSSTVQAETGSLAGNNPSAIEAETAASKPIYRYLPCQVHGGPRHYHLARQYADMVVVGVLIAFVALVTLVELWSPMSQGRRDSENTEGTIRLADEKSPAGPGAPMSYRSFVLQPAPTSPAYVAAPEKVAELV